MIVVEDGGRIVVANRRAEALFGYAHGELLTMSVEDLVPEPVRVDHIGHGTTIPIDISLSPVYKDRARIVIVSMRALRDPTGHDRELLQASSRRLLLLADQMLEGLRETAFSLHASTGSAVDTELAIGKLDDLIRLVHSAAFEEQIDLSDV